MSDFNFWLLFLATAFALNVAPGPDLLYILTKTIRNGKKVGLASALGVCTGALFHVFAAAVGLSMILVSSALAFGLVKYIGAAYLLYIAYQAFKYRDEPLDLIVQNSSSELKKLFVKGFIMNILNPKVSIFFLAFLPQFVNTQAGSVPMQMIILGIIFMIMTVIVFSSIGIAANMLSSKLLQKPSIVKYMNILTSFVLVGLGLKLALSQR